MSSWKFPSPNDSGIFNSWVKCWLGIIFLPGLCPIFWCCGWCFHPLGWLWNRESQDPERLFEAADRDGSGWGILQNVSRFDFLRCIWKQKSEDGSWSCRILFDQSWKWKHELLFTLHGYSNFDQKHTTSSNLHDVIFMTSAPFDHMCWSTTDISRSREVLGQPRVCCVVAWSMKLRFWWPLNHRFFADNLLSPCVF